MVFEQAALSALRQEGRGATRWSARTALCYTHPEGRGPRPKAAYQIKAALRLKPLLGESTQCLQRVLATNRQHWSAE